QTICSGRTIFLFLQVFAEGVSSVEPRTTKLCALHPRDSRGTTSPLLLGRIWKFHAKEFAACLIQQPKSSLRLTRYLALSGGLTQVTNSFYRGTSPRIYVDSAPHTVANGGLTLS